MALATLRGVVDLGGGDLPHTVYLLRAVTVIGVLGAAILTARLVPAERRPAALLLIAGNPLVILHLIGGVHLDAVLAGLGVVVVAASHRGRWALASAAAVTAFAVKLPAQAN